MHLRRSYSISIFITSRLPKPYVISYMYIESMYANYGELLNDHVAELERDNALIFRSKSPSEMRLDSFGILVLYFSQKIHMYEHNLKPIEYDIIRFS